MTQHNPQGKHPQREPLPSGAVYGGVAQQQRPVRVGRHGDTPIASDDRGPFPVIRFPFSAAGLFDRRAVRGRVTFNVSLTLEQGSLRRPNTAAGEGVDIHDRL